MIPLELFTMLGSTLIGGALKIWSKKQDIQAMNHRALLEKIGVQHQGYSAARQESSPAMAWTRRTIALTATFAVILLPKLAAIFTDTTVVVGWTETTSGFWFFTDGVETIRWYAMKGLVITPLDTHLMSAIAGLYFGGSIANGKY